MSPGVYTGTITITGSSVASDNKTITVTATVTTSPIIGLVANSNVLISSYAGGPAQTSTVTLPNLATTISLSATAATTSAAFLTATTSGNTVQITATPGSMAAGLYTGTVKISSNAANNAQVSIPVEFTILPAGVPSIFMGGIVNAANGAQESVSQGDVVAIYGSQLAAPGTLATNPSTPLATTLGGSQVLVNGVAAPLYFVSPGQINFQLPYGLSVSQIATVQVNTASQTGNIRSVGVAANLPRLLFFVSFIQGGYGVIVNNSDGSLTLPTGTVGPGFNCHPAKPGDVLTIYGIGFGQTSPVAVEGVAATSSPLQTVSNVVATFGGGFSSAPVNATPSFTGLTPTAVGLYQVNVAVPALVSTGAGVPLSLNVNGQPSNTVYVAISANGK
jgi:uncharacterized protein (TIGR03437 family)